MYNVLIVSKLFIFILPQYIFKILSILVYTRVIIIFDHIMNFSCYGTNYYKQSII